jgi:hypothetical protein
VSLIDVIASFATGDNEPTPGKYKVTRQTAATVDSAGYAVDGTPSTLLVTACVQPTNGRDLRVLLEAGITEESKVLWTETPVQTRRPGQEPDVVTIDGEDWVVHQSRRWEAWDEVFYRSLIARRSLK